MRTPSPLALALAVLVALLAVPVAKGAAAGDKGPAFAAGEVLIKLKPGKDTELTRILNELGAKVLGKIARLDVSRLKLPRGEKVERIVERLKKLPQVAYAEPNYLLRITGPSDDARWSEQWDMRRMGADQGWAVERGSSGVVIAIVDTGVDLDHPDLKPKLVAGHDFVDNDDAPDDVGGHGTHCAGIAAAATGNGVGVAGVCPGCAIMPIRVMDGSGTGAVSAIADGVVWAADHGARVISLSLGGPYTSYAEEEAINYAWSKGAVVVAAAGNDNMQSPFYPAWFERCIAVGASDENDARADFSDYGPWVDVAAPGTAILSTVPGGGYEYKQGTSMAAPHVAGLAGLVLSRLGASGTNVEVRRIIEESCDPVGDWVARGRVNVVKALALAGGPRPAKGGADDPKVGGGAGGGGQGGVSKVVGLSPNGFAVNQGFTVAAPKNSLVQSDDGRLELSSAATGYDRVLDFQVSSRLAAQGKVESVEVVLEASLQGATEITASFYNFTTNGWDWIGRVPLGATESTVSFKRGNAAPYVSQNGDLRVKLRALSTWWKTITVGADMVRFNVQVSVPETKPAQDKPLGDKAKDAWKKLWGK
ncbi:MAG: S8 family peptidase [Deltaproteobacteria bacterium]|nr:S8 family peptidase [Deltaproteobacteria bacterium]